MQNPRAAIGRRRATAVAGTLVAALAATTFSALPAQAAAADAGSVVSDSLASWYLGETRTAGHNTLVANGLHVWTEESANGNQQSKAAAYRGISVPLDSLGEPSIEFASYTGVRPSIQLGVDKDGNGTWDGYVVGEPWAYGDGAWWSSKDFGISSGMGYTSFGTLADFRAANPHAVVTSFGYSLGSGVIGDAVISKLSVANVDYTFKLPTTSPCVGTTAALVSTDANTRGWGFTESGTGGSNTYVDGGLNVATVAPQGSQSKAAGYVAADFPLQDAGVPSMDYTSNSGERPGLQMTISLDGAWNGNLVYEPLFDKWWGTRAIPGVPAGPNSYQKAYGTLDEILAGSQGHAVRVIAVGYSLGANAIGDATIRSITAGCTTHSFTNQKHATVYPTFVKAPLATETNTRGWTAGGAGTVEYVDGGVKLSVPGDWTESWIERAYSGTLASIGSVVDFDATPSQYVGIHLETAKGEVTFEKDASYGGKWWSTSDFGVEGSFYASFASFDDYVTANPDLQVSKIRVLYTSSEAASTVVRGVKVGGVDYTFTSQKHATAGDVTDSLPVTGAHLRGWTTHGSVAFVDGGVKLTVPGDWAESWIERAYDGTLASLGTDIDFTASPSQYVGIRVLTTKGEITYEQEASYTGNWWSTSDFGVGDGMGYASFASLDDYITANPDVRVLSVRVSYTHPQASEAVLNDVTFGGVRYSFTEQLLPTHFASAVLAPLATDINSRGWTASNADDVTYVDGGVKLSVPGSWAETWIEHSYDGSLASIGDLVDFTATSEQYVGIHLETAKGEITFEKDPSYDGRWWSKSDFGVDGSWYASFATLSDFVTANPDLQVTKVRLLYTNENAASTVISSATFGGVQHTFASAADATVSVAPVADVRVGTTGQLVAGVSSTATSLTGSITVSGAFTGSAALANGSATFTVPSTLAAGDHTVTLSYSGDDLTHAATTMVTVHVVKYPVFVTAIGGAVQAGDTFKLPVVVLAPGAASSNGHVVVKDGAKVVGEGDVSNNSATVSVSGLGVGTHTLDVAYAGNDVVVAGSSQATVVVSAKPVPPVTVFPSYVAGFAAPGSANKAGSLAVQVIAPGATVSGTVKVTEGKTVLGTATLKAGKATVKLPPLTAGTHQLTVAFASSSATVASSTTTTDAVVVKAASTVTATWAKSFTYGKSSSVSVKVAAANGLKATGKVEVREGTKVLKSATLSKGAAAISLPKTLKVGSHKLTVVYLGTSQIASARSASKTVKVVKASSKVSYSLGAKRTVVVKVSSTGTNATGKVQLVIDPAVKGAKTVVTTATLKAGKATVTLPRLSYGTYAVSVKYLGSKAVASSKSVVKTMTLS